MAIVSSAVEATTLEHHHGRTPNPTKLSKRRKAWKSELSQAECTITLAVAKSKGSLKSLDHYCGRRIFSPTRCRHVWSLWGEVSGHCGERGRESGRR